KETNSQVGEERTTDIKTVANSTLNKTQSETAQKSLSIKNLSVEKKEGTNREITEAEFQEISNPAKLTKTEVEDFINFLITSLNKCNYPGNPSPEEKNAMKLAKSYLSGEISPATLLEEEVFVLDLESSGLHALPKGISLLQGVKILRLGFNKLVDLPEEMIYLKNLKVIDLIHNPLESFPRVLYKDQMPNLINISLASTRIKELPISLKKEIYHPLPHSYKWVPR
ncbi:MAG: hypothetical protein ACXWM7_08220, partial [Parachlamydiaceae bacterium]